MVDKTAERMTAEERKLYFHRRAVQLVQDAEHAGVIVEIHRLSQPPLAMRNHVPVIETREKR